MVWRATSCSFGSSVVRTDKPALVELLLTVIVVEIAPHFLGEIFGGEDMRAGRPHRDVERRLLGLIGVLLRDVAVLGHAIDHVIAALDRRIMAAERIVVVRTLRQAAR